MKRSEKYLEKLKAEKEFWQKKLDALPGSAVSTTNPVYIRSVNAANKYAAAKYMMKLMLEEIEESKADIQPDDFEPITHFFQD